MNRRIGALGAIAILAILALGISNASAASLTVIAGKLGAFTATHPCPGTARAVPAKRQTGNNYLAVVMALPPGCGNRSVQLTVVRPSSTARTGSGTTDVNGRVTITLNNTYDVTANNTLLATVSGWNLPAAWAPPFWCTVTTTGSTATCAATVTLGTRYPNNQRVDFYHVVVTTLSTSWVSWEVTFNLADPFYGTVPTQLGNARVDQYWDGGVYWAYGTANANDVQRSSLCATFPGELRVTGLNSGTSPNVFRDVNNTQTRTFDLLVNVTNPTGYADVIYPGCT